MQGRCGPLKAAVRKSPRSAPHRRAYGRDTIYELMIEASKEGIHHLSAEDLLKRALGARRRVSLATIYRTLLDFEKAGVVIRHQFADLHHVYELSSRVSHDHVVNLTTGEVHEFNEQSLDRLKQKLAQRFGVKVVRHTFTIFVDQS